MSFIDITKALVYATYAWRYKLSYSFNAFIPDYCLNIVSF